MTFEVNGTEVGVYDTNESHQDFYFADGDDTERPNAVGLADRNLWVNGDEVTAYVFLHRAGDGSLGLGFWFVEDTDTNITAGFAQRTVVENLTDNISSSGFVFDRGQGVLTGGHGQHDFVYAEGTPVTDEGNSDFAFEEGTGLSYENVQTLVEDDEQSFGGGASDDRYETTFSDVYADHLYGNVPGDGVIWSVSGGNWSVTASMEEEGSERDTSDTDFPARWYGVGPSGSVDAGPAGAGTSVSITVDV